MVFPDDITIFLWLSDLGMLRTHRRFGHRFAESMMALYIYEDTVSMGSHINGILR